jgi:hypothetical protein
MSSYSTPYQGAVGHVSLDERQRICESVVGAVEWNPREHWGYCTCPGQQFHTNQNGRRDCRVYADETPGRGRAGGTLPPGVTCLHTSCRSAVENASHQIRSLIGKAKVEAGRAPRCAGSSPTAQAKSTMSAKTPAPAQSVTVRTGRTPVFKLPGGAASASRTARTDISRPYALHAQAGAQAHACAHVPAGSQELPSDPSTRVAKAPATVPPAVAHRPAVSAPGAVEKPGILTLCFNGEPAARVEWDGNTLKRKFEFKSNHDRPT